MSENKLSNGEPLVYAVILSGGKGERFWPKSRRDFPKQLLKITDNRTMVETTVSRIEPLIPLNRIYLVASEEIKDSLLNVNIGIPHSNYLFEPFGRNTAPAIGLACFNLLKRDSNAIMVVLPADHYIKDNNSFLNYIKKAVEIAKMNFLVTFGIVPVRPETGYGYIESGEEICDDVCKVKKFKEKPSQKKANEFIKKGNFLWNSGIFVWGLKTIMEQFRRFQPLFTKSMERYNELESQTEQKKMLNKIYNETESISIDYAIMEKTSNVAVVRTSFDWDDVGSWSALERLTGKDKYRNIIIGDTVCIDTEDSIIVSEKGVIGTIGVSNFIIVHTDDATLVLPKEREQEVKEIVRRLSRNKKLKKYT